MSTLYEILGVNRNASPEEIEHAYQAAWKTLKDKMIIGVNDEEMNKAKALKEAYSVLSIRDRRAAYDAKISIQQQPIVIYAQPESSAGSLWVKIAVAFVILGGAVFAYRWQAHKEEAAKMELQAAKAKAESDQAQMRAEAEQARLAQKQLDDKRRTEEASRRETERARREAERVTRTLSYAEERAARERIRAEQQARYEQMREEQMARAWSMRNYRK